MQTARLNRKSRLWQSQQRSPNGLWIRVCAPHFWQRSIKSPNNSARHLAHQQFESARIGRPASSEPNCDWDCEYNSRSHPIHFGGNNNVRSCCLISLNDTTNPADCKQHRAYCSAILEQFNRVFGLQIAVGASVESVYNHLWLATNPSGLSLQEILVCHGWRS